MKIALVQIDVKPSRPRENVAKILEKIDIARSSGAKVISFPEMAIGGYLVGDKWQSTSFCEDLMCYNEVIREASEDVAVIYGNVYLDKHKVGYDGRDRKYNAAYAYCDKKPAERIKGQPLLPDGVTFKTLLPNYRFFDDKRYFFPMTGLAEEEFISISDLLFPFEIFGRRFGVELCEDLWWEDYGVNPTEILVNYGANTIINISSSPWTYGKNETRDRKIGTNISTINGESDSNAYFYYINRVGVENNGKNLVTYDGSSSVYDSNGELVDGISKPYAEGILYHDEDEPVVNTSKFIRQNTGFANQKYEAIVQGLNHIKYMIGKSPNWVVGLSGGLDSAVVADLLVHTFGRRKVLAVQMPSPNNSEKTKTCAKQIARNLGIELITLPIWNQIEEHWNPIQNLKTELFGKDIDQTDNKISFDLENAQARIRMTILASVAAKYNALYTCNANKVEIAAGYGTIDGDMRGSIAPIGDLTKEEVIILAKYINSNAGKEVIPEILLPDNLFRFGEEKIAPSAELVRGQVDPLKYGYHCHIVSEMTNFKMKSIEDIMEWYLEGSLSRNLDLQSGIIERYELDDPEVFIKDLEWLFGLANNQVFKRVQSVPIIITSKTAYGFDRRESILNSEPTERFFYLKGRILGMNKYKDEDDNFPF